MKFSSQGDTRGGLLEGVGEHFAHSYKRVKEFISFSLGVVSSLVE